MAAMERVARGDAMDAVGGTVLFFLGGYIIQGPAEFVVSIAAFFLTEFLIQR